MSTSDDVLRGRVVRLRAAIRASRRAVWEWMACSDLTASMAGPPDFAEAPAPTWEQFCADYAPLFFDGSRPERGCSFIIERIDIGEAIGHISYDCHSERPQFAELDIWMRDTSCCGGGYGSEALQVLSEHLHESLGILEMNLRPSARNVRAIRAYEKAGFTRLDISQDEQTQRYGLGEYRDTVVMQRTFDARDRTGA